MGERRGIVRLRITKGKTKLDANKAKSSAEINYFHDGTQLFHYPLLLFTSMVHVMYHCISLTGLDNAERNNLTDMNLEMRM
jgi:hypothetical protein